MAHIVNGIIQSLLPHEIFVFGSNLAGRHGKGAALTALRKFGACYGVGRGLQGNSYALPTKDGELKTRTIWEISSEFRELASVASANPDLYFYLTAVGSGLAGIPERFIRSHVIATTWPKNVTFWWEWSQPQPVVSPRSHLPARESNA